MICLSAAAPCTISSRLPLERAGAARGAGGRQSRSRRSRSNVGRGSLDGGGAGAGDFLDRNFLR